MKSDEIRKQIFKIMDNSSMSVEDRLKMNDLIFAFSLERWIEGQNSGIQSCKKVYQK